MGAVGRLILVTATVGSAAIDTFVTLDGRAFFFMTYSVRPLFLVIGFAY